MAKYIYNTAEFTPISFEDRIKPYLLYKKDYEKAQDDYINMIADTQDLDALKDLPMDNESYKTYKSFKDDVDRLGTIMNTQGFNAEARRLALDLRRRQALEINPLKNKQKIRADLAKEKRSYLEKHPDAIFDIDVETTPLSQINESIVPRGYDLSDYSKDWIEDMYSNIVANNGNEIEIDYDKYRNMFNYDSLSKDKQEKIDHAIASAGTIARAKYNIAKEKFDLENRKLDIRESTARRSGSRGGGSGSSSSSTAGKDRKFGVWTNPETNERYDMFTGPNGDYIKIGSKSFTLPYKTKTENGETVNVLDENGKLLVDDDRIKEYVKQESKSSKNEEKQHRYRGVQSTIVVGPKDNGKTAEQLRDEGSSITSDKFDRKFSRASTDKRGSTVYTSLNDINDDEKQLLSQYGYTEDVLNDLFEDGRKLEFSFFIDDDGVYSYRIKQKI